MLAASWRMRRSPLQTGSCPSCSALIAASQLIWAIGVVPSLMLVKVSTKPVKSLRDKNPPWLMSSSLPASSG